VRHSFVWPKLTVIAPICALKIMIDSGSKCISFPSPRQPELHCSVVCRSRKIRIQLRDLCIRQIYEPSENSMPMCTPTTLNRRNLHFIKANHGAFVCAHIVLKPKLIKIMNYFLNWIWHFQKAKWKTQLSGINHVVHTKYCMKVNYIYLSITINKGWFKYLSDGCSKKNLLYK